MLKIKQYDRFPVLHIDFIDVLEYTFKISKNIFTNR